MKKLSIVFIPAFLVAMMISSFTFKTTKAPENKIEWLTIEEAEKALKKEERNIFIDVYTSWCGPCKMMDKLTFTDPAVVEYVNKNYYAVKLNAESKEPIKFNGKTYQFNKNMGRNGIHNVVFPLTDNKLMGYPTISILNEDLDVLWAQSMFLKPAEFLSKLKAHNETK